MSPEERAERIGQGRSGQRLDDLIAQAMRLAASQAGPLVKMKRFHEIGARISEMIQPYTPCARGCSHCCKISVVISREEAALIAAHTGRAPEPVKDEIRAEDELTIQDELAAKYTGVPCTFLGEEGECTVYPVRPFACRTYHSLENDAEPCDVEKHRGARVGRVNLKMLDFAVVLGLRESVFADIREFFPHQ